MLTALQPQMHDDNVLFHFFCRLMARRAAGLVIFRKLQAGIPEWLLLQTSYGEHHWTPPKGHLDPGEDDITAAVRETREEAGLKEEDLEIYRDIRAELKYEAFGNPKIVTYWLARLKDYNHPVKLSEEHQDMRWLSVEDAINLCGFEDMGNVYKEFQLKVKSLSL